jgi:riboflavin synthase
MFTGIVEELGTLREAAPGPAPGCSRLVFGASLVTGGTQVGDSISVNGCCLTVVDLGDGWWSADAVEETLRRTNLGTVAPGHHVNLERPLRLSDRLGGHLVQGHVDGVGTVVRSAPDLSVDTPASLRRYLVEKGSITVDGVSLTVVEVDERGFTAAVIPHTMAVTTLGGRWPGDRVNLEVDIIAKYAERLLSAGADSPYPEQVGASVAGPESHPRE